VEEMPKYECHKTVHALKIHMIEAAGEDCILITPEGNFAPFETSTKDRPKPEAGWYFVQYEGGYTSFSPAKQFEDGYSLIQLAPRQV